MAVALISGGAPGIGASRRERLLGIDALVHCAGVGHRTAARTEPDQVERIFQTNFIAVWRLNQLALDQLRRGSGAIDCASRFGFGGTPDRRSPRMAIGCVVCFGWPCAAHELERSDRFPQVSGKGGFDEVRSPLRSTEHSSRTYRIFRPAVAEHYTRSARISRLLSGTHLVRRLRRPASHRPGSSGIFPSQVGETGWTSAITALSTWPGTPETTSTTQIVSAGPK